nr:major facilitator superfamily MFS_1 [Kibdelosporangium sp. MJ126-NF4]CTQ88239.1 major facilitator superfamily MFS_1 [Kibdelosporangium sp. MJ126-NF4]
MRRLPGYGRFWAASTMSSFGTPVTAFALQMIALETLHASNTQLGLLNAARWAPYLVLGLVAGVLVDRYRRKPVLVTTDLGRAALLCVLPVLAFADLLTMSALVLVVFAFGVLSLLFDAANQSFLPRLVPKELLTAANARLEQSDAAAQTTGPILAGGLIKLVGAPVAILYDAITYLVSGLLLASIPVTEPAPRPSERRPIRADLREGLTYVYRHRMLAPAALSSHLWFLANSMLGTVYLAYVLRDLRLGEFWLGVTLASASVGAVLGGAFAQWAGRRFGVGRVSIVAHVVMPVAWVLVPLASSGPAAVALLATAQFVTWATMGAASPNEMSYRQSVTPDHMQGRMNATIRSLNRGMIVIGAPLGGILADTTGYRTALWTGITGLVGAALILIFSPFRHAKVQTTSASTVLHPGDVNAVPAPDAQSGTAPGRHTRPRR